MDSIFAHEGDFYFSARPNDSSAGHAPYDDISQIISVEAYEASIAPGFASVELQFSSNGWGDGDTTTITLVPLDGEKKALSAGESAQTSGEKQIWRDNKFSLTLPSKSKFIKLRLRAKKNVGTMSDAHLDNFRLNILAPSV